VGVVEEEGFSVGNEVQILVEGVAEGEDCWLFDLII
jgi:hypothetical protein